MQREESTLRAPRCGLDASSSGYRPAAGPCEQGGEPLHSIKDGEFVD